MDRREGRAPHFDRASPGERVLSGDCVSLCQGRSLRRTATAVGFSASTGLRMKLTTQAAGKTDIGVVRKNNEDNFGYDTRTGIFVVCDGMGGQAAGEVASKIAVDTVLGYF